MNIIIWLVLGGIVGWLASIVMRTNAQQGLIANVIVGIVGALLGGLLISPIFGIRTLQSGHFSIGALVIAFLGALILLAGVNLFRRGRVR